MKSKRYNRRALSAMMYSKDHPRNYLDGPCLVHNKKIKEQSKSSGEAMDFGLNKDDLFHMQAIKRERSASLPSADISVNKRLTLRSHEAKTFEKQGVPNGGIYFDALL